MKRFLPAFFIVLNLSALAQSSDGTFTGSFQETPLQLALEHIEADTDARFFFESSWLDSLTVSATFERTPVREVITSILTGTSLNFYMSENLVILTNNVVIVDEPAILQAFISTPESVDEIEKGLVFSREYKTENTSDLENFVFEIGNRKLMRSREPSTLAGYVKNEETGEPVEGALVYIESPFTATSTDESGFYSLSLPTGKHTIIIQFVGMKTTRRTIVLFSSGKLNVDMPVDVIALQEVMVEADRDINVRNVQMGVSKINIEEVKTVPIVLGENDIMKIATTKAGVQSVGEGASGFNVRGGKADQNLILINDAPIYNASHFFGFFSVFNSDAIRSMDLFKSGIPAKYGGRLSSVFDIQSRKANKEQFAGKGGISPITSRLTLEIPLIKEKTSLLVGGRTTYSNWVLSNVKNAGFRENNVSFFDVIAELDHKIDEKNSLSISSYISRDKFRLSSDTLFSFSDFSYMNGNGSIKWNHRFSDNFEGVFSGIFSRYNYDLFYDESPPNAFTQDFDIHESTLKADLNYYLDEIHKIGFGMVTKLYGINPGEKRPEGDESIVAPEKISDESGLESAVYISDKYDVNESLSLYGGLRYVIFNSLGPRDVFTYEDGLPKNSDTQIDSTRYRQGEIVKTYHGPEWRFSARYALNDLSSVKLSLSRTRQYVHTLSNSASLSPTDTWRLSGRHILPQTADQVALGFYRNFFRNTVEVSVEGYYKRLQELIDFKTGSTFLLNEHIEREVLQGPGKSYGVEFSLTKAGRLNGWFNYAYARTFIRLDGDHQEERVNGGQFFPTAYDKPHTANLVANYKLTRRLSFSLNTTYATGRPVTVPVAAFDFKGSQNIHFSGRNAFRIPDYFRVDFGISLEGNHKIEKLSHSFWSLSIYNVTGRDNPFSVFFDVKEGEVKGYQLIVFGNAIPTLSYNFEF